MCLNHEAQNAEKLNCMKAEARGVLHESSFTQISTTKVSSAK